MKSLLPGRRRCLTRFSPLRDLHRFIRLLTSVGRLPRRGQRLAGTLPAGEAGPWRAVEPGCDRAPAGRIEGRRWAVILTALLWLWPALPQTPAVDDFSPGEVWTSSGPIAFQEDGRILVGSSRITQGPYTRYGLVRLHPDGGLDLSFQTNHFSTFGVLVLPDGRIVAAGVHEYPRSPQRRGVERFTADGAIEADFFAAVEGPIEAMALLADGRILVGGMFQTLRGQPRAMLGRLNSDGSLDADFEPDLRPLLTSIHNLAIQPDGKILVAGRYGRLGQQPLVRIIRLHPDGSLDGNFTAPTAVDGGRFSCVVVQADGDVILGGDFSLLGPPWRTRLARLYPHGSLDEGFQFTLTGGVRTMIAQSNGQLCLGGYFTMVGQEPRAAVARINANGQLDPDFQNGVGGGFPSVDVLALQADGKLLVGGLFDQVGGRPQRGLGRFVALPPAVDDLRWERDTVTWRRGGSAPEVSRAVFEFSTDGREWWALGAGARIAGGWELKGVSVPAGATVRALGLVTASQARVASWWVSAYAGKLIWLSQPEDLDLGAGEPARFSARAGGDGPLRYRWFRDREPLADNERIKGADTPFLLVSGAAGTDAGEYFAVVENNARAMTSRVASLRITDPRIVKQPADADLNTGQRLALAVTGAGTPPLAFQWWKDGAPLEGQTSAELVFESVLPPDGGLYWVVVSNSWGSVTSRVAVVMVRDPRITREPDSLVLRFGQSAKFDVAAVGTEPLRYEWWKNEARLTNADLAVLDLGRISGADRGDYRAVVHSAWGSVTSRVAQLIVEEPRRLSNKPTGLGVTSRVAQLIVEDPVFHSSPATLARQLGEFAYLTASASGSAPLTYQWWKDGVPLAGETVAALRIEAVAAADAGLYSLVVSNPYGSATSAVAEVSVNLAALDLAFAPEVGGDVHGLCSHPDGRIAVSGWFPSAPGVWAGFPVLRFDAAGRREASLGPLGQRNAVCLALRPDGELLAGGLGAPADGFLLGYDHSGQVTRSLSVGSFGDPSRAVRALALQPDGKVLLGGWFDSVRGVARSNLVRLHPDWSVDLAFHPPPLMGEVRTLALQPDGSVLVGGDFLSVAGQHRAGLVRLNADGKLDDGFWPEFGETGGNPAVNCVVVQADGRILVGGGFNRLNGHVRPALGRLHRDGTLDAEFQPPFAGRVASLALQADGKIIATGYIEAMAGRAARSIARLHPDGRLDSLFNPPAGGMVVALALQSDGTLLAGGSITSLAGMPRDHLARVINPDHAGQFLDYRNGVITWLRSGASSEVWLTTFESSADAGATWRMLGHGERISGGWGLGSGPLHHGEIIRARGFTTGGNNNGSASFVETRLIVGHRQPPAILRPPQSQTVSAGSQTTLTVQAAGDEPLAFQWYAGRVGDTNDPVAGVSWAEFTTPPLTQTTQFWVRVSNPAGSVDSAAATLTVRASRPADLNLLALEIRDGQLRLLITGPSGTRGRLERSADLLVWESLPETGVTDLAEGQAVVEVPVGGTGPRLFRFGLLP